jgi:hypothetical protein
MMSLYSRVSPTGVVEASLRIAAAHADGLPRARLAGLVRLCLRAGLADSARCAARHAPDLMPLVAAMSETPAAAISALQQAGVLPLLACTSFRWTIYMSD